MNLKIIKKKILWKGFIKIFFIEVTAHLIVCTILSFIDYKQALAIFFIGLIFPDFLTLYVYIYKPRGTYPRVKKYVNCLHGINLLISLLAIFNGYPLIGIAGISHSILDYFGL